MVVKIVKIEVIMPLIQILNYSQKKEFETPPLFNNESRQEIFLLPIRVLWHKGTKRDTVLRNSLKSL